ncbi:MAG: TetR/AcrR family transcriptional regulator fatty acid metabolism regulator protein [bacterium]|nr:MAG: TetR/AcrR family transcriptional regulator fatty acid metabolism regulator protein [bacterium]
MNNRPSLNKPISQVNRPSLNKPLTEVIAAGPTPDKYESILLAAIRVFARNGFFNSKVADVAKDAGVADGTVYLYFKNKEDLLISIFNYIIDEAIETARRELTVLDSPNEKIRKLASLHLDLMGRDENLAKVFQVELRQLKFMEQFSTSKLSIYFEFIRTTIEQGQQIGIFRKEINSQIAAKVLYGALDEMVTNWILSRKEYNLSDMADPVVDIFLNGVKK